MQCVKQITQTNDGTTYYAIGRLSSCECSDEDFLLTNLQHMAKYSPTITRFNGKYTAHAKTVQVFKL